MPKRKRFGISGKGRFLQQSLPIKSQRKRLGNAFCTIFTTTTTFVHKKTIQKHKMLHLQPFSLPRGCSGLGRVVFSFMHAHLTPARLGPGTNLDSNAHILFSFGGCFCFAFPPVCMMLCVFFLLACLFFCFLPCLSCCCYTLFISSVTALEEWSLGVGEDIVAVNRPRAKIALSSC